MHARLHAKHAVKVPLGTVSFQAPSLSVYCRDVQDDPICIIDGARTAYGSFLGQHHKLPATTLGAAAIQGALVKAGLPVHSAADAGLHEILMGNVLSANLGQNPPKQAATQAGLPPTLSYTLVNKVCASGMKAVMLAASSLLCGFSRLSVAGGMESMSNCPYYDTSRRLGVKMGDVRLLDGVTRDGLLCASQHLAGRHMGDHGERCAHELRISRHEQDAYALESFRRARAAEERGILAKEIVPSALAGATEDEPLKRLNQDKMRTLKPYFKAYPDTSQAGSITAANASPLTDGAAALLLCRESVAKELGLKARARIVGMADAGQEAEWYTTAPSVAVKRLLARAGKQVKDIDVWEINEAFAVVVIANMNILGLDHTKVNMHGGAIALGHPIGTSGARIILSLLSVLEESDTTIGVATICNGGGGASAVMLERC